MSVFFILMMWVFFIIGNILFGYYANDDSDSNWIEFMAKFCFVIAIIFGIIGGVLAFI